MKHKAVKILGIILLFIISIVVVYYVVDTKVNNSDAIRFSQEYTKVDQRNVFVYKSEEEIISILASGTGIVYLGFPECPWCQSYVKMLNEVAMAKEIDKIYYYNIRDARKNNTEGYKKIVALLNSNLLKDENNNYRVYVPDVSFVVGGKILWHDNETSVVEETMTTKTYWTNEKVEEFKQKVGTAIDEVFYGLCSSCNE